MRVTSTQEVVTDGQVHPVLYALDVRAPLGMSWSIARGSSSRRSLRRAALLRRGERRTILATVRVESAGGRAILRGGVTVDPYRLFSALGDVLLLA